MSDKVEIVLNKGTVIEPGLDGKEGETYEVSASVARLLVGSGCAVRKDDAPAPAPKKKAAKKKAAVKVEAPSEAPAEGESD